MRGPCEEYAEDDSEQHSEEAQDLRAAKVDFNIQEIEKYLNKEDPPGFIKTVAMVGCHNLSINN